MSKLSLPLCGLLLAGAIFTSPLSAQLQSSQQGWFADSGDFSAGLEPSYSYRVGAYDGQSFRNYFIFDRSSLTSVDIQAATLDIFLPDSLLGPSYFSADPADLGALFSVYKFEGSLNSLKTGSDPFASFDALAPNASLFGSVSVSEASNGLALLSIELNSVFLDYLNSIGGEFALAGGLSNADASPLSDELMFLNSESVFSPETQNPLYPQLRLQFVAVPEPSTYGLIGAAFLGLLIWRRRAVKNARVG